MTRESTRPRSGTRGVPREVRAAEILEAAAAEFGTHGYAGAQVTAVAERAGVSKALVLAYFGSKEKLYIACVQKAGPLVFDAVRDAFAQPDPDALPGSLFNRAAVRVLTGIVTSLEGRIGYWALLYDRSVPDGDGRVVARGQRHRLREQSSSAVAGVVRAAGLTDPRDQTAAVLVWESMISGVMQWWRLNPELSAAEVSASATRILAAWSVPAPSPSPEPEKP
ncbi:AcrR family transcriptional regulator [Tsukamurella ocularis]|nr:AcrR family transcriptional regulator [Tsukamurella ocularis]MCS3851044.1 AcrR family transcriptional regulator [Tsukamurella ocularis]